MAKFSTIEEITQLVEILKGKPEIDQKITYYKGVLKATDCQIKAIATRIERGYTTETFKFLGAPINKRIMLDEYDIAKLEIEKLDAESKLFYQQQYFENWLQRSQEFEKKTAEITSECNDNYDMLIVEAIEVAKTNPRLALVMSEYDKKNPDNDQRIKNEYYLFCKKEVENFKQYGKNGRKLFAPAN